MNLLLLATKPPWPPIDGGRLLLLHTLQGLAAAGVRPVLVAPADPGGDAGRAERELSELCEPRLVVSARPRRWLREASAVARAWRVPPSMGRHAAPAVRREVARLLASRSFDLVHVEQLQALLQASPAFERGVPVVLRAQNVESDLWAVVAGRTGGWKGRALAGEAARLARWEGAAVRRAAATLALTGADAGRLAELAGLAGAGEDAARVRVVRAPFPAELPGGRRRLPGEPAVVVLGSRGWLPNEDAVSWFLAEVWPAVRREAPGAALHLFGEPVAGAAGVPGVALHPAPEESAEAFAPGSVLAVPLRIGSGVRMKVLEAWARGVPVVGTPTALAGLEVEDGREALVAGDAAGFARALARLHREPGLARRLIEAGRSALRERHDPAAVAAELLRAYREPAGRPAKPAR